MHVLDYLDVYFFVQTKRVHHFYKMSCNSTEESIDKMETWKVSDGLFKRPPLVLALRAKTCFSISQCDSTKVRLIYNERRTTAIP